VAGPANQAAAPGFGELTPLLAPRSVAVVGASDRAGNLGGVAVGLLRQFGFHGPVWPVNPGRAEVGGLPCYGSLGELPDVPDLAIFSVPGPAAIELVEQCGEVGIPAVVLWAGGFAEVGEEGRQLQERLAEACRRAGVKLCGPNCLGIMNWSIGLMATFGSMLGDIDSLTPGSISMVSQSGGMSGIAATLAQQRGFGFRVTVSCGNEAVLTLSDFVRAIVHDEATRVIALYLEGIDDPDNFVAALDEARRAGKAVIVMKAGASEESGRAALAHTGRLAGSDRTFEAIFREFAAIRVHSIEELLDVALELASQGVARLPQGRRVVSTTFGGGSGVLTADLCIREHLVVPELAETTRARLGELLTPLAATNNPVDLTPQSMNDPKWRALLPDALKCIADDPGIDMFLFMAGGMGHRRAEAVEILKLLRAHTEKPVTVSWMAPPPGMRQELAAHGFHMFDEHARAVRAVARIAAHAEMIRQPVRRLADAVPVFPWEKFVDAGASVVAEHVVAAILDWAGLPVAEGALATSADHAQDAAGRIGFPVAVKGVSQTITHRAAAGLLALGVESAEAVAAYDARFRARARELNADYDGTWIQKMYPGGVELIVSGLRDPDFGILIGCGIGGSLTEVIDDIRFARAPIDGEGALNLLGDLRTLRRRPDLLDQAGRQAAARFVADFSRLAAMAPWARFNLEVNPLKVGAAGALAVDGLLVIDRR
jgi:acyl-CoA synthetase (NDP forming)